VENRPVPPRYLRHLTLPEIGERGQRRLGDARVLVVGAGGLGSPAAMYLTAAGIGRLDLVDFDVVDESNLQRQILYSTADVGRPKLAAAAERLRAMNPHVDIQTYDAPFDAANARALVRDCDVVVDGTDNFQTRYLVNDACVLERRPNVYGSIARFEGQASVFGVAGGPCYRCLHPDPPPAGLIQNCADAGVLGVLPGVIGSIQATEAIKLIAGIGEPLIGRVLLYDALRMRTREIGLPRDPDCPVCGDRPTILDVVAYDIACAPSQHAAPHAGSAAGSSTGDAVTVADLRQWREARSPHMLLDVREPSEHAAASIDGAVLIPIGDLDRRLDTLPRDRPIVVHCQSGGRSSRAVARLRREGFDARNLQGGIRAWISQTSETK
jgi:adenylyltransferase/sulfurtransferase